jgi:hypothetical protein
MNLIPQEFAIFQRRVVPQPRARIENENSQPEETTAATMTNHSAANQTPGQPYDRLKNRIQQRQARIGIIGLGYVGLPLALLFSEQKFAVTGFDIDQRKVDTIAKGESYIFRISAEEIRKAKITNLTLVTLPTPHTPSLPICRQASWLCLRVQRTPAPPKKSCCRFSRRKTSRA